MNVANERFALAGTAGWQLFGTSRPVLLDVLWCRHDLADLFDRRGVVRAGDLHQTRLVSDGLECVPAGAVWADVHTVRKECASARHRRGFLALAIILSLVIPASTYPLLIHLPAVLDGKAVEWDSGRVMQPLHVYQATATAVISAVVTLSCRPVAAPASGRRPKTREVSHAPNEMQIRTSVKKMK